MISVDLKTCVSVFVEGECNFARPQFNIISAHSGRFCPIPLDMSNRRSSHWNFVAYALGYKTVTNPTVDVRKLPLERLKSALESFILLWAAQQQVSNTEIGVRR